MIVVSDTSVLSGLVKLNKRPVLDELIEKGFRIHPQLYRSILNLAGE